MALVSSTDRVALGSPRPSRGIDAALARFGTWLRDHQALLRRLQWAVVVVYAGLLVVPAVLPLPQGAAHIWTNVTLFAQFVFWGIWWPFVLLSMVLVGRLWCGLLCPEGALSERASEHGRGGAIPHWLQWKGWPFVAFVLTTVYGQMTSVYQYPRPALLVLGGSTVAAIGVGYLWGRNKRVWCRFLCPVNGVFNLLAKLAPLHFRVDREAWAEWSREHVKPRGGHSAALNCAPLVPVRAMRGAGTCHMCGRCSDYRGAVTLARRSPNHEIVHVAGDMTNPWQSALILFGLLGVAAGAFHWGASDLYVTIRQFLADRLAERGLIWPMEPVLPWYVLTNYPELNDTMTPLDGLTLLIYIGGMTLAMGLGLSFFLGVASRACGPWSSARFHHFAQGLIPVAGCGVFLGLSSLTVTMLKAEGIVLPFVSFLRAMLLVGAGLWSLWLGWRIAGTKTGVLARQLAATLAFAGAVALGCLVWAALFWKFV
ncbi:4Fe-4S binding protein [Rhodoblastus sp.]|jgi:polyferredoxin|uniref:4Fe-4S binding protein n=1 Tax=Rhodoblastus sp. TaxID=1962975 RepID=UPI002605716A|nr:4Fe-4S binding protein [Rhodoblastus sp.]